MPDLSVIVPVYNGERYLPQLLESITAIHKISMEILLIDDGSIDRSRELIEKYQKIDTRIKYQYKVNGGIVSARNQGLELAAGTYLFFADQDDRLEAEVLTEAILRMKESRADMLLFSTECFHNTGTPWECDTIYEEGKYTEKDIGDIFIRKLITRYSKREVVSYVGHIWAAVFRRELVKEQNIIFKRFMAIEDDLLFVLDSLDHAKVLLTMKETGYFWRQNPNSRTRRGKYSVYHAEKMQKYYEYRTEVLVRHQIVTDKELQDYYTGVRQEFYLNLLDNEAMLGQGVWKARKILKQYLQDAQIKEALKLPPQCPLAVRYKLEKMLLSNHLIILAILYKKVKYRKSIIGSYLRKKRE